MAWPATRAADLLGVRYPIVQAPMAGATTPELVAAVSNAGGLGSFGAARTDPEELRATIQRIRELTDRPFGINVFAWPPFDAGADAGPVLGALEPLYEEVDLPLPAEVRAPFDPSESRVSNDGEPCPRVHRGCANSSKRHPRPSPRSPAVSRWETRTACRGRVNCRTFDPWRRPDKASRYNA